MRNPVSTLLEGRVDEVLVDAARAGSSEAFGELVVRYRAPLVRLAYRLTHDHEEADDIAQDAFIRAYRGLGDFRPDRPFARWLFVIARNASLDAIRRRRRSKGIEPEELLSGEGTTHDLGPEELALQNDEALRVRLALDALPPKYREVLELYYLGNFLYREIAERLAMPIGTVKTYISRAKRRLRHELEAEAELLAA